MYVVKTLLVMLSMGIHVTNVVGFFIISWIFLIAEAFGVMQSVTPFCAFLTILACVIGLILGYTNRHKFIKQPTT